MSGLPKGWVEAKIGDVCDYIQRGKSPKYIEKSELPIINQKCVRWWGVDERYLKFIDPEQWPSWTEERFLVPGDVLWNSTGTGTIGRAALFRGLNLADRVVVDSHVTILRPGGAVTGVFLHRFIQSPSVQNAIADMQSGTTNQVELNRTEIIETTLPLPPLAEQKRIVAKLDALNAKSARARTELARIETLVSRYKQAVLSKAFSGELTPRYGDAAAIELDPSAADQIDGRTLDLPPLPAAWNWVALCSVAEISGGLTKNSNRGSLPLQLPYLRVANVYANELRLDDVSTIGCTENEVARTTLRLGDLLLVEGNGSLDQIGRVALWGGELDRCVHQNHLIKVRPNKGLESKFALYWLLSPLGRRAIEAVAASSAGLHTLSLSKVGGLPFPFCNSKEQHEIVRRIESAFARINRLAAQAKRALELVGKLDEAILAKAFRGELVPQDENDEPASALLARIRAEREAAPKAKRGRSQGKI